MDKLHSIVAYFCLNYPYKGELSKTRLTKLVYLADWYSALIDEKQLTNIEWVFNHYGPYVDDIMSCAKDHGDFSTKTEKTIYGSDKCLILFSGSPKDIELTNRDEKILDLVIEKTKGLYFNDFINFVYSTYPIRAKERYSELNLIKLAKEYKDEKAA